MRHVAWLFPIAAALACSLGTSSPGIPPTIAAPTSLPQTLAPSPALRTPASAGNESSTPTPRSIPSGIVYFIAPDGDDAGPGTAAQPWRSLQHAADFAPFSGQCWDDAGLAGFGAHNIYGDPLFADPRTKDFHLMALSPAIDTGIPDAPTPGDDLDSQRRDSSPDLGAYEFGGP